MFDGGLPEVLVIVYFRSGGCLCPATVRSRRVPLTSNYILRKIMRFEATCTYSWNKQKVSHFRKDCVSTMCFSVYSACQMKQRVLQPNLHVHPIDILYVRNTRYSYHIHTIFTHDIIFHWVSISKIKDSIRVNIDTNHLKNSLKHLLACNWRYLSLESFTLSKHSDVELTCLPERTLMWIKSCLREDCREGLFRSMFILISVFRY